MIKESENGHSLLFEFEKALLQKKNLKKTQSKPEFQNFFFKFNITLEWFIPFKCTICEKVFNWFHPLKTRFTKPRFSENPHLVNKSLLTKHVSKWGFYCTWFQNNFGKKYSPLKPQALAGSEVGHHSTLRVGSKFIQGRRNYSIMGRTKL